MQRRWFLRYLGILVASPTFSRCAAADDSPGLPRVLVIGAGLSGLAAAKSLTDAGVPVRVIEARDRLGGRLWTDRSIDGVPLDLGASWIHGVKSNPVYDLVASLGIKTIPFDYDNHAIYRADGSLIPDAQVDAIEARFDALQAKVDVIRQARIEADQPDIALSVAIEQALAAMSLGPGEENELRCSVNTSIEHEYASATSALSLYRFDEADEIEGGDRLVPGGWDQLVQALARAIPDLRMSEAVQSVEVSERGAVSLTTTKGVHTAEAVICTVPLGVLKAGAITFKPPLDEEKRQAIQRINFGVLDKLFLKFATPFWDAAGADILGLIPDKPGQWAEHLSYFRTMGKPFLLSFNAGAHAIENAELTDQDLVSRAMVALRHMFGDAVPEAPLAFKRSNWSKDPFSRGSYSSAGVGSTEADFKAFEEPHEERVFFAGEHTSVARYQTLQGAYQSGLDAAGAVKLLL